MKYFMNRYSLAILIAIAALAGCQKPQYVEPTFKGQGILSLTGYFTFGQYEDLELTKLIVEDPEQDVFVLPVPFYYPAHTDLTTTKYMSSVKVVAGLANNCRIEPPLTILDLNLENEFTFYDAQGNSKPIIITGERVRSSEAKIESFKIKNGSLPTITGFVNNDKREIYLFTTDDLNGYYADATVSAHSSILPGQLNITKDYNQDQKFVIVADDGTEWTYTVMKKYPTKLPYGIRDASVTSLFHINPVKMLGFPGFKEPVYPSMGYADESLVISFADGSKPVCIDPNTGIKKGELNVGNVDPASVTSDEGGNLLLTTYAPAAETCEIYRTKSVTAAPELFFSFKNETDVPVGYHVKVHGNIDNNAVILLTHEGVAGVTETSKITRINVEGGVVASTTLVDLSSIGCSWADAPQSTPKAVAAGPGADAGIFVSYYSDNTLYHIDNTLSKTASMPFIQLGVTTNNNTGTLDSKTFNNAVYVAQISGTYFSYALPALFVFDVTNPSSIVNAKPMLANDSLSRYEETAEGWSASDILIAQSSDGFKVYIFYYDHNSSILGAYSADCISL